MQPPIILKPSTIRFKTIIVFFIYFGSLVVKIDYVSTQNIWYIKLLRHMLKKKKKKKEEKWKFIKF